MHVFRTMSSPNAPILDKYAAWTVEMWDTSGNAIALRDLFVMQAGIPGEASEVSTVLLEGRGRPDLEQLKLEVGDVVYYWCRVSNAFQLPAGQLWGPGDPTPSRGEEADLRSAAMLGVYAGRVSEALKKHVRDREIGKFLFAAPPDLKIRLTELSVELIRIMNRHDLDLAEVIEANKAKLTDRRAKKEAYDSKYGR